MTLVFVGHRCCDHSPSGGYDQICALYPEAGWLSGPELAAGQLTWFREPAGDGASVLAGSMMFHVFYGDCSGSALPAILRARFPGATIVSTVHQPVSRLQRDPAGLASLDPVDGIIAVAENQARDLARHGLAAFVNVVPHGVWTHVFRPPTPATPGDRDNVLFVGNYLRDWAGMRQITEKLAAEGVRSVVLGSAAARQLAIRNPLLEISPRVPEPELAAMYDRAAALVLPVLDATASNALLEAMAAGCPVICPRLSSLVDDYLSDDSDSYEPGRYDQAVAHALSYVEHPGRRAARSPELMRRAQLFDWARLRPLLAATYEEIVRRAQH
jgi:glycosyltransferase involved in cell wall biosynthesis